MDRCDFIHTPLAVNGEVFMCIAESLFRLCQVPPSCAKVERSKVQEELIDNGSKRSHQMM
jgi:hypothetical protein